MIEILADQVRLNGGERTVTLSRARNLATRLCTAGDRLIAIHEDATTLAEMLHDRTEMQEYEGPTPGMVIDLQVKSTRNGVTARIRYRGVTLGQAEGSRRYERNVVIAACEHAADRARDLMDDLRAHTPIER